MLVSHAGLIFELYNNCYKVCINCLKSEKMNFYLSRNKFDQYCFFTVLRGWETNQKQYSSSLPKHLSEFLGYESFT